MPAIRAVFLVFAGWAAATCAYAQTLSGRVVDDNDAPVAGARITMRRGEGEAREAQSGPTGDFRITAPGPGDYLIGVAQTGYFEIVAKPVHIDAAGAEVTLVLNAQREVFQSVQVGALPDPVAPDQTQRNERLSGTEVNDIPFPASNTLRNSMKLMPGVLQDPTASLHFHGGAEYQTQYTLNGFDITNPIDGRFATRLAVEGVRSLDLSTAIETAPYGRGSAGTLAIQSENGTDHFHYTATNFIPGLQTQNGFTIGDWTPRVGVSGPIIKGRAWFADSFDGNYNTGYVSGLPKGQNTNAGWAAGNLLHTQVNAARGNIVYVDFLSNFDHQAHLGLGPLDPPSTTSSLTDHQWLAGVKDSQSWGSGNLVEFGFAWQSLYRAQLPVGDQPYILSPNGRTGNYFFTSHGTGRRDQIFANLFPRARQAWGRHQLQIGADAQWLNYDTNNQRTGVTVISPSGLPLYATTFTGSGIFKVSDTNASWYVNDHWQPTGALTVDAGLRLDWDRLVGRTAPSPRIGFAWAPFHDARTKISGGYALLRDAVNLSLFSRPLDQAAVTVPYTAAGAPEAPLVNTFSIGSDLRFPRYDQFAAGAAHSFAHGITADVNWMRKRGRDGFVYAPVGAQPPISIQPQLLGYGFGGDYILSNLRRDQYDEESLTVRQNFGDQFGWLASYVHSRDVSNAVLDIQSDQPLQSLSAFVPTPWDAPNRLLGWAYLPIPRLGKNWAVATLVDWRSGFPFSPVNEAGIVEGVVNSLRYPSNFDLNLHIERRVTLRGYRFAIRVGGNNLTGHRNPTAVNNIVDAQEYRQFYGDEGRHFVVRIRMFGRAGR
jgi:Carboxypeptidase regulatory-like domain